MIVCALGYGYLSKYVFRRICGLGVTGIGITSKQINDYGFRNSFFVSREDIKKTLQTANCQLTDIVKAMVWLSKKEYFPGFNEVFSKYFPVDPPARSAVVNELLVDVKVEIEVIAYKPE